MEHRRKLIDVFPYALGTVTPEVLAKRKEIERLTKTAERFQRDLTQIRVVAEGWKQEVAGWLIQAREYGLTNYIAKDSDDFSLQVSVLRAIAEKRVSDSTVSSTKLRLYQKILLLCEKKSSKSQANCMLFGDGTRICFSLKAPWEIMIRHCRFS